ncbi:penicillin-binding protein [Aspergillus heteromorphus CBS 117.55]|uniref:Penicillin-binding protein n=1 Tax=Aspergillus heteromorphus CBS 117.55 TaxID=1448321 RepID=A0A317WTB3_9EURO|nr:penicillin-binding protein [Aspergillus heteromorphus CBS 117.55]PWY88168.1 penicillin-binding protein [Aspergillus heteromorphus CBS 117.55]
MSTVKDSPETPLDGDFEKNVHETLEYWKIPGMAVAVVDGDTTWTQGYGTADLASSTDVESNTLFYGGSTTKAFTAAIMAMLVEDNDKYPGVQWTTPVNELIREDFVLDNHWTTANVTIEDILSHRTGMPGHNFSLGAVYADKQATVQDVVRSLRFLPSTAPPRTTYQYNNAMYIVASHLIQTVMGDDLGSIFQKHIWDPLGMSSTYFRLDDALASQKPLAKGYAFAEGKYEAVEWKNRPEISGAGAIISTVEDYAKWIYALLNQSGLPLSSEGYGTLWTARALIPNSEPFLAPMAYALGWDRYIYQGVEIITHDGGIEGFGAEIVMIPALKFGVITMANSTYSSNYGGTCLAYELIDSKLGIAAGDRFDWKQKYVDIVDQMDAYNADAVQIFYPDLPSPPLPGPTLAIEAYSGTYWHDAYGRLDLSIDGTGTKLHADRTNCTNTCSLTFENVTGNYFIIRLLVVGAETVLPAEFSVDPDGKPRSVGIGWEPTMGIEKKIWMRKVDGDDTVGLHRALPYKPSRTPQLPEFLTGHLFV